MLPTMQPVENSSRRTKRGRGINAFEEVRIGPLRLYFSHFELIGFQLDGKPPVVSDPPQPIGAIHIEARRFHLEPDKSKWCSKNDFEKQWEDISATVFR
jgi:hypothetical protein